MAPSPNALISQLIAELSKIHEHCQAISEMKSAFILHGHQYNINIQYTKHNTVAIQYLLMVMDASYIAMISGVMLITPSFNRNLLPGPVLTQRTMVDLKTNENNDDDSRDCLAQADMILQMGSGDDFESNVCSLHPTRSSNQ